MTRTSLTLLSALTLLAALCEIAFADGGQVRAVERYGDREITVFTSPTPMRAGSADISVAVQSTTTGELCDHAEIVVELKHRGEARPTIRAAATNQAATNKLLRAALVDLTEQGIWDVTVYVHEGTDSRPHITQFAMEVAAPWPTWLTEWPWFCWPVLPILLFVIHRLLVAAHSGSRQSSERDTLRVAVTRIAPSNSMSRIG